MATYGQIYYKLATPMSHASDRSPRGGDRHGPNHASSGALCVELSGFSASILNGVTGRAAAIARPTSFASECYFQVEYEYHLWI